MRHLVAAIMCLFWGVSLAAAQDLTALARFDAEQSAVNDRWRGASIELMFSQGVPWRVFTLDDPRRLVVDFREVDWGGVYSLSADDTERVSAVRFGQYQPGWSRMVVDLAAPLGLSSADMRVDETIGQAALEIVLELVSDDEFASSAGAPDMVGWRSTPAAQVAKARMRQSGDGDITVVIDAGHGGIDPGAEHGDDTEKDLMLAMARELKDALLRAGRFNVILTREDDSFVPLETRVAIARHAEADLFLSLHADALGQGQATGATVYTLSETASDEASAALAERHDREDLLAGVDLSGQDDTIAGILMDLAWLENQPRSDAVANAIVLAFDQAGIALHKVPRRAAGFSVLKAPDIPSILIEAGYLSSKEDRDHITDPAWRATAVDAIRQAIESWVVTDAAIGNLVRQ